MNPMRIFCVAVLALFSFWSWAADIAELPYKYDKILSVYDLNADGTHVETHTIIKTVQQSGAVEQLKSDSISYSASIQSGQLLEAYTLKANGHRIDVPKQNYQINTSSGKDGKSPFFSDKIQISVVFPDVAVGDKVALTYRINEKSAMFPGQFSLYSSFSKYYQYDNAEIIIRSPETLKVYTAAYHMQQLPLMKEQGKVVYHWLYKNPLPRRWSNAEQGIDRPEDVPGVLFSTFASYHDIAEAYGLRARPKAAVSERIKALATTLASGKITAREKSKSIYDWVAQNISYGGNCIGVGAVVPRDMDVVLDNKMGDCKDHATLLQALLTVSGIKSTQVLINASDQYELPSVPVVSNVNHVINYLPEQNIYLDSTSATTPFGMLPASDEGKPVLHVDDFKNNTRTPVNTGLGNVQHVKTRIQIRPDGSAAGDMAVQVHGIFGVIARSWFKELPASRKEELVKKGLANTGFHGKGEIKLDEVKGLDSNYQYSARFEIEDLLKNTEAGVIALYPLLWTPAAVSSFVESDFSEPPVKSAACAGGHSVEEYEVVLPEKMKILYLPKVKNVSAAGLSYSASYQLTGNTLIMTRKVDDVVEANVCSPQMQIDRQIIQKQMLRDFQSQILFQLEI